jgi:hypothetical protein
MKKVYSLLSRVLAAIFGGVIFAIITPLSYWLIFKSVPTESFFTGLGILAGVGFVIGAILGALFPKVFGFIFELFTDA